SLPILGIPTFWFTAWHLQRSLKLSEIALNMGHAPETLVAAASDKELLKKTKLKFHFSDESREILGSSGALWKLKEYLSDGLIAVSNGDSICFPNWKKMIEFHKSKKAKMTLHLRPFKNSSEQYTDIEISSLGTVKKFGEKKRSGLMFSGSYLLD